MESGKEKTQKSETFFLKIVCIQLGAYILGVY